MKRCVFTLLALLSTSAFGQTSAVNGYCEQGAKSATVSGLNSTNKLQGVIPGCTVTVYLTGTGTLATIYADAINTPLTNPFTSNTTTGQYLFYATQGVGLDVARSSGTTNTDVVPGLSSGSFCSTGVGGCTLTGPLTVPYLTIPVKTSSYVASIGGGTIYNDSNNSFVIQGPQNLDALFGSLGSGDVHFNVSANSTTSTTSISPGTSTITVGSTTGFTTALGIGLVIGSPYDTSTNESVASGNFSIVDGTHFQVTVAKSHTQPYIVSQQGAALFQDTSIFQTNRNGTAGVVWYQSVIGPGTYNVTGGAYEDGSAYAGVRYFRNCVPALETTCDYYPRYYGYLGGPLIFYGSEGGTNSTGNIVFTTNDVDDPTPTGAYSGIYMTPANGYMYAKNFQASVASFSPYFKATATGGAAAYQFPGGSTQQISDDSVGGINLSVLNTSSVGYRFWKNGAGATLLGQIDQNGNYVCATGNVCLPSTATGNTGAAAGKVQLVLNGTTGTITGTALTATCDSGTSSVTGAAVGHPVAVSSTTGADVGGAFNVRASVTSTNTVTVYVCGTGTPASLAYNVTVF
jgi:hypothetical protein